MTVPLEQDLLNGVKGVDTIRSDSIPGLSSITLLFERGTDILRARQLVSERLSQPHAFPTVGSAPQMIQPVSSTSRVMMITLSSRRLTPVELSVLARWTVRPRLMGIPGVANVAIWGHRDRQLQVLVDPARLRASHVSLLQRRPDRGQRAARVAADVPQRVDPGHRRLPRRPEPAARRPPHPARSRGRATSAQVPVEGSSAPSCPTSRPSSRTTRRSSATRSPPARRPTTRSSSSSRSCRARTRSPSRAGSTTRCARCGRAWPGDDRHSSAFRPAELHRDRARPPRGWRPSSPAALVALALAAFLMQWRAVVICLVAIPLSLVRPLRSCSTLTGATMNALVVAGLVVALGAVVDDAVVGVRAHGARPARGARGRAASADERGSCSTPRSAAQRRWATRR